MSAASQDGSPAMSADMTKAAGSSSAVSAEDQELHITCIERTASALLESEGATPDEIEEAIQQCEQALALGKRFELLELLARLQGHEEEFMGEAIYRLSESVSHTLLQPPVMITFAAKLIAPNAFYASFPDLKETCAEMLCPVIFAEDSDAIGTGSINPIAAAMMAERIANRVKERHGIRPFITMARLDYESWCFLTRKHFET
jgi:hypothetical protein